MGNMSLFGLECRQLRHDGVFWLTTITCILALLFGLANGQDWRDSQSKQIRTFESQSQKGFDDLIKAAAELRKQNTAPAKTLADRNSDPRYALGFEGGNTQHICRHPGKLSVLAVGQSDLYNACILVSAWEMGGANDQIFHRNLENPLRLLLGRFDAAFVIISLLPIAILVLTYNLLSGERELGTLSLLKCQPIPLRRVIAMRFVVRAFVFLILVLIPIIFALWMKGISFNDTETVSELALWLTVTAAYVLFWFACGFWTNARGKSSAENGLVLAGLWLLLVVILPGTLNLGLKQLYPMPSRMEQIDASREATIEVAKKKTELLGKYLIDHPDRVKMDKNVSVDDFIQTRMVIDDETKRVLAPIKAGFDSQQQRQRAFVERLRFLSPSIAYQQITQMLTGQGQDRQQRFLNAVDNYHLQLRAFYFPRFVIDSPDFRDYSAIPGFDFQELPLTTLAKATLAALLGVVLPGVVLWVLGMYRFRRPLFESK